MLEEFDQVPPDEFDDATDISTQPSDYPIDNLPPGITGTLVVIEGPERGRKIELEGGLNTIGREEGNLIRLDCRAVSGMHAVIFFAASMEWRIKDLGSTNGTLLNGSTVKEFALRFGDKIVIGDYLFMFSS